MVLLALISGFFWAVGQKAEEFKARNSLETFNLEFVEFVGESRLLPWGCRILEMAGFDYRVKNLKGKIVNVRVCVQVIGVFDTEHFMRLVAKPPDQD